MKYYGVMYHLRNGSYVEGVGDRAYVRLDGRMTLDNMMHDANDWAIKHKFDGYRVARGKRLTELLYMNAAVQPVRHTAQ